MVNKYQLSIVLLLVVLAASIKIIPKSTDGGPISPNPKDSITNSASKTTVQTAKKSTSQTKEDDTQQKNELEAKTNEEQTKNNKDSLAVTASKSTSNSKNAAKKDPSNKLSSKKTAADKEDKAKEDQEAQKESNDDNKNTKSKKSKGSYKKKPGKSKDSSTNDSNEKKEEELGSGWGLLLAYIIIFAGLIFALKRFYFKDSTLIQMGLDIALLIISFAKSIKDKRSGYKPAVYSEQIDDENTVNVGYGDENGNQLFWEKNSVEGI